VSAAAKVTDASLNKLDLLIESGVSEEVPEEVSQTRLDFHERQQFVSAKAEELNIVIQALAECDSAISKLKSEWTGPYRDLYRSDELEELQEERGRIAKDQSHHETALQRYFDSVTASTSKGEKTDKVFKLTLATDLETRKAGFRQIQLVDLYCLSRGKELWAILPSITRIGHDIDPIKCMHWRPDVKTMPEALQSFWREQSRAFAKQLLMLCTPTQRSTLLGARQRIALMKSLPWRIRTKNGLVKKGRRTPRTNIGPKGDRWITKGQRGSKRPQPLMIFSTRDQACVRRDLERSAPQVCP